MEPDSVAIEAIRKISSAYLDRIAADREAFNMGGGAHMKLVAVSLALAISAPAFAAPTSCRSHRMGSTTYTKCDDGKPSTPPTSCRTYTVGSTTYTKCATR
jgi:hypothetical protein